MKTRLNPVQLSPRILLFFILSAWVPVVYGQIVFTDNFFANTNATYTTSGQIGASAWSVTRSGDDWGARRNTAPAQLELTNDVGATANADGYVIVTTPTASFSNPYNTTLSAGGLVTWTFNMRQIQADPDGFDLVTSYGVAYILAGTSNTTRTTGSGYAVVLGQAGATDPVRLVSYSAGLSSAVNMVTSNTAGLTDIGANYLSIKVTYNPCDNNKWEFFLRNDGASAFALPTGGTLVSQGTSTNNLYVGTPLPTMAAYWQGTVDAARTAFFDNVQVTAVIGPTIIPGNNPSVCMGATLAGLQYFTPLNNPTQYSINWNAAANSSGFVDVTNQTLPASPIVLAVPGGAAVNTYHGTLTVRNASLCESEAYDISVSITSCTPPLPSTMRWVLLPLGHEENQTCFSSSDCSNDMLCYGLEYTPLYTGDMTTYTTGFFVECYNLTPTVLSNGACVLNDHSETFPFCVQQNVVLFNSSTDGGDPIPVTKGLSRIIHQVCFLVPTTGTLTVVRDDLEGALSTSIDSINGGGPESDTVTHYLPLTIDSTVACAALLLPVKWLSFNAVRYGDLMSQLDWSTAEEVNNSYFEIQRSTDNGVTFQAIGKVKAAAVNQAVNHYRFIDQHASKGENFYRIKQVDFDHKWAYSAIRIVSFEGNKNNFSINAWPNPVSDILTIDVQGAAELFHMSIFDSSGRSMWEGAFEPGSTVQLVDVASFGAGVYSLVAKGNTIGEVQKIVVIR